MQIHKRSIIIGIIVGILLLMATWYITRPQGVVEFALAPDQLQMEIDGKVNNLSHGQKVKMKPGLYKAVFSREGFADVSKSVTVTKGKMNRIVIALTPQTEEAKQLIESSETSKKVVQEYKKVRVVELTDSLPISGVDYSITSCKSLKNPTSDIQAICIAADSDNGEKVALNTLMELGYDVNELELLIGTESIKTIIRQDDYKVDYYTNVNSESSSKPGLYITPLNVPYVAFDAPSNPQLESIKTRALNSISSEGYDLRNFDVFYSNIYLSRYNADINEESEHAMPPVRP